jgi:tetratricopeptide (TPR) repeat protein
LALDKLGKYKEAIECYDKALATDAEDVTALNNKGVALDNLGKYKDALKQFDKVLAIDPNNVAALRNKINALNREKYQSTS